MALRKPSATSSTPQKTSGAQLRTKNAATRRANSGSSSASYVGSNRPNSIATGFANGMASLRAGASPTLTLPTGTPTVTPVAPPRIDPFLTPTDEAQESVENGQWDDYISGLLQQQKTQDADVGLATGDVDRSLAQGLESNDWNAASRGLQNSSIKDQNKAQMVTQAAATKGAEVAKQGAFHDYVSGQQKQVNTVYKPAIERKYNDLRVTNARAATDAWNASHPQPTADAAAPQAPGAPAFTPQTPGTTNPSQAPTAAQLHGSSDASVGATDTWQPVIKGDGFYHYYPNRPAGQQYVYIRPATH